VDCHFISISQLKWGGHSELPTSTEGNYEFDYSERDQARRNEEITVDWAGEITTLGDLEFVLTCWQKCWTELNVNFTKKRYELIKWTDRNKLIVETDRSCCPYFFEFHPSMPFEIAEEYRKKAELVLSSQNDSEGNRAGLDVPPEGKQQECQVKEEDLPLYKNTPTNAKWKNLTMAFPSHIEDIVDITFRGGGKNTVLLKDLGFVKRSATKEFVPYESLVLLKKFAKDKHAYFLPLNEKNKRGALHAQVKSLRNMLERSFGIGGDPVPADEKGGYHLEFKAYCYDRKEKEELDAYLNIFNRYIADLKEEANNSGKYYDKNNVQMIKQSIIEVTEEILKRDPLYKINNVICTECFQKIPSFILSNNSIQILCEDCMPEPSNEYKSKSIIDYKVKDIPRSD
jgi:hypothetical protein